MVADEYSDPEKGSGAVKITPAHDFNDFEVGKRHALAMPSVLDADAKVTLAELALEATQPGVAFALVTAAAWPEPRFTTYAARHPGRLTHAVAFGAAAAFHDLPLRESCFGWLAAFAANIVSAGVRLVPLGQTDGQIATAALLPVVEAATEAALALRDAEDLGSAAPALDLSSMRHETQYTRLFRS